MKSRKMENKLVLSGAAILLLVLYIFSPAVAQPRSANNNITIGSSLAPRGQSAWLSPSGIYAFGFYQQAKGYAVGVFLAGVPQKTVVWTANRDDPPVPSTATLVLRNDGRLVLQIPQEEDVYVTGDASFKATTALMLDTGNFVLYNSDKEILWESFKHPTTTILQGQPLLNGAQLFSSVSDTDQSTGFFRLAMQPDGNLVLYPNGPNSDQSSWYAYWATMSVLGSAGDNVTLNLNNDGRLYMLNSTGFQLRNISEGGYDTKQTIYLMTLDPDGIFRIYSYKLNQTNGNRSVKFEQPTDKCAPKGRCGLNSYCVTANQGVDCRCLPGFTPKGTFITAGCERNFTMESCKSDGQRKKYTILPVVNTVWEDAAYSVLSSLTRKDCEKACSEDCVCEVAMFKDGICKKQKLPLRYGRFNSASQDVALVKVGESAADQLTKQEGKQKHRIRVLIIGISMLVIAIIVLVIAGALIYRGHVFKYKRFPNDTGVRLLENVAPISFNFADIERMTNSFKEEIGRGAFGTVFKGTMMLDNGLKVVAVKRLDKVSNQGEQEFQNEMKIIGRTHHRNLVQLLGYCHDGANRLLIYEYMINGSLADILFTPEKRPCWNEKVEIARNIARGLLYLHEECETQIIHCDIKSQNILMDEKGQAKISDFGLAKLLQPNQTKTSFTGIRGTRGYVAPEWHRKMPVTVKADVYSFGVVVLEIICCRRSVNWSLVEEEAILEEWVYKCFQAGKLRKLVGDEEVDEKQLERMVRVGLWCILDEPTLRPSMKKVLLMMEGTVDIPIPPNPTSFFSSI